MSHLNLHAKFCSNGLGIPETLVKYSFLRPAANDETYFVLYFFMISVREDLLRFLEQVSENINSKNKTRDVSWKYIGGEIE